MKTRLDLIESRLQALIEGLAPFSKGDVQSRLAHQLVEAMHDELSAAEDGRLEAPCRYTIFLDPFSLHDWRKGPEQFPRIASGLEQAAQEAGVHFNGQVTFSLVEDIELLPGTTRVVARWEDAALGRTAVFTPGAGSKPRPNPVGNSFLIVEGNKYFTIQEAVTNLGRRPDNHLVIDDPRVSRVHAQIRLNRGQFILFDLNSTGGTMVNGQRIRQHVLQPGDVISLSGVAIIYGEETPPDEEIPPEERTRAMKPADSSPPKTGGVGFMTGILVLVLRILMTLALLGFLGWALYTIWRDLRTQAGLLVSRKIPALTLSTTNLLDDQVRAFNTAEIVIGRSQVSSYPIQNETVSSNHARLSYHHEQWWVEDLHSTNGTFLNEARIQTATVVMAGDELRCGQVNLNIQIESIR